MKLEIIQTDLISLPDIVALNSVIFATMYEHPPYSLQQYQEKLKNVLPYILIAKNNNQLVGDSIAFERNGGLYLWILGVDASVRRLGIASQLLDLNEKYAVDHHLSSVTVKVYNVSPDMQRLLISRNYLITDITPSPNHPKYNAIHFALQV